VILGRLWKTARVGGTRRSGCSHAIHPRSPWVAAQEILKLGEHLSRMNPKGKNETAYQQTEFVQRAPSHLHDSLLCLHWAYLPWGKYTDVSGYGHP